MRKVHAHNNLAYLTVIMLMREVINQDVIKLLTVHVVNIVIMINVIIMINIMTIVFTFTSAFDMILAAMDCVVMVFDCIT